ncbi:hypothetical protein AOQ84DRAFT_377850 [Glonium stellatum]|uniref:RRM domain-containing protein n=1 Tax=Glonium stellatum TaxID=574774 RepID=A0A8E2JS88_9PEZI|nr:hypothetical protein AOQ84DRAFT_377850 [Glonium stellatum]
MAPPVVPAGGANGVLPISASVLQKNAPASAPRGPSSRASAPRLKLVLRRLPPGLTKAEFEAALGDEWKLGGGKVDWWLYKPGKISKDLAKPSKPSRAILRVTSPSLVAQLSDFVRQTPFNDAANSTRDPALIGPPALEFAPYTRVPGGRRRNDARQGLIDQDPEFKDFLESLTNPVSKPTPPDATAEGTTQKEEKVTTTPLIEHLREKKANKDKPPAKPSTKHARGESREDKAEKGGDKKILSKAGKENVPASPEKGRKLSRAALAAVRVQNKEASATAQGTQAVANPSTEKGSTAASTPAPERKRERGNASIAAKMLQRDLGIGPAANRRRGTKREVTPANQDATQKSDEASTPKEKEKIPAVISPSADKPSAKIPTSPKKESTRPTRAERRAYKATLAEKTNQTNSEGSKPHKAPNGPPAPVILKKPSAATQAQTQPPRGPAAPRVLTEPSTTKAPTAPVPPTGPALQTAPQTPTNPNPTPISPSTSRQAFLKHANPSQGITEPLIEAALSIFGIIEKVEIDKRKGFAYVDFVEPEGLQKAIAASPVKVAQGAVHVLERKEKVARRQPPPPTGPSRGRGGFSGRGRGRGGGRGGAAGAAEGTLSGATSTPVASAPVAAPAPTADAAT